MKKYEINYLGKQYKSESGFEIITDTEYEQIKNDWYKKPPFEKVRYEMAMLKNGGSVISEITNYYFRELMDNTTVYHSKYSINEVFSNKELLSVFVDKTRKNPKVFSSKSIVENIDTAFRLGGKGLASKVAQFPLKTVDYILEKYNVNNNWYDFSCGWGGRLAGALKNKVNYYGTDPNYLLYDKLLQFNNDYKSIFMKHGEKTITDIKCQGSEVFVGEWENKIGLAFSSPPYFALEDYKIGNQSYKNGTTYEQWLQNYMFPTFKNINRYLIDNGFLIVNIKDYQEYTLEKDTIKMAEKAGFYLYCTETLQNNKRSASVGSGDFIMVDNNETCYVFAKNGCNPETNKSRQISLFEFL